MCVCVAVLAIHGVDAVGARSRGVGRGDAEAA